MLESDHRTFRKKNKAKDSGADDLLCQLSELFLILFYEPEQQTITNLAWKPFTFVFMS